MQATLPVRTFNATWSAIVALVLAVTIMVGAALAFGISSGAPTAVDQPARQTIEQSVVNHAIDERSQPAAAPVLRIDPDAAGAGTRSRLVNVPQ